MNKQGVSILMVIFEILVVIIVAAMTAKIATTYGQTESVQAINIAEDIFLMINALAATPGDAIVEYPSNISAYTIVMTPEKVAISGFTGLAVERTFHLPDGYRADGVIEKKARLCLEKKGRNILLEGCI